MTAKSKLPYRVADFKPGFEPAELDLSDFEVSGIGGRTVRPFVGESLWVEPFLGQDDEVALLEVVRRLQSSENEPSAEDAFTGLCEVMSRLVYAWTITDKHGQPYPDPHHNPEAFRAIPSRILLDLITLVLGGGAEAPAERGKGAMSSGNGSSPVANQETVPERR
jgi:hypothetical protein